MWNKYINNSSFKCLEIEKNDQVSGCEKWQKMTENDTKWHKKWLKMRQVIKTYLKDLKKSLKDCKWSKMTKTDKVSSWGKNDKKWLKMTRKGSKLWSKIDVILKYQLFNL